MPGFRDIEGVTIYGFHNMLLYNLYKTDLTLYKLYNIIINNRIYRKEFVAYERQRAD